MKRAATGIVAAVLGGALALAPGAAALEIRFPHGTMRTAAVEDPVGPYTIAAGRATLLQPAATVGLTGIRQRIAWRAPPGPGAAFAMVEALRRTLEAEGFERIFSCVSEACGGFDFRRDRALLPMPDMIVDLSGFTYLAARRGPEDAPEALASVMASDGPAGAHAQLTLLTRTEAAEGPSASVDLVAPPGAPGAPNALGAPDAEAATEEPATPAAGFDAAGRMVLEGVRFETGSDRLPDPPPQSLGLLAAWLEADPARRVAIVGHTDATGPAEVNRALSRRRAQAVADALTRMHGVAPVRLDVEGAGPFAPRASNATEAGRAANRRVEAVILAPGG